jgi:hypothetical protein
LWLENTMSIDATTMLLFFVQFKKAGAVVSLHVIDADHGWARHNADVRLARSWLANIAAH